MPTGVVLVTSVMVPVVCLGMLMLLAWLEDTLVEDVNKTTRRNTPQPIVAVPVKRAGTAAARPVTAAQNEAKTDDDPTFPVAIAS